MKTIEELIASTDKKVYVWLSDKDTAARFISNADAEGYRFADGAEISSRRADNFYAVRKNKTVNYINSIGRIAFQSGADSIIRIDYKKYVSGSGHYII